MFSLDHDPVDGSHLIVAGGELDLASTSEMSAIFAMSAAGPQEAVVLDLVGVDFIDSSALGTILRAAQPLGQRVDGLGAAVQCGGGVGERGGAPTVGVPHADEDLHRMTVLGHLAR